MNVIEVVGGLKQEVQLIKDEFGEKEANNVVEIGFEDILKVEGNKFEENEAPGDNNFDLSEVVWRNESDISTENPKEVSLETVQDGNSDGNQAKKEQEVLHINFQSIDENDQINIKKTNRILSHEVIEEADDRFLCFHCKKVSKRKIYLKAHIMLQHRENPKINQCPHCPYKSKHAIKNHIKYCHLDSDQIEWFQCLECGYRTKFKPSLQRHIWNWHMDLESCGKMKKCDQCDKQFKNNRALNKHKRSIHERIQVSCELCEYTIHRKQLLQYHIQENHADRSELKDWKCDQCSFTTKFRHKYTSHKSTKHSKNIFQCHICSYQVKFKDHLNLHLIHHQKEKKEEDLKYKCTECSYKTYRQYSLTIHQIKHKKPEDIQYFKCFHCEFKANRKDNLKTHIARHNKKNEILVQCFRCNFQTKTKSALIKHIKKHSEK